jgi:WD40 repeat protein
MAWSSALTARAWHSASKDQTVKVWDVQTGQELRTFKGSFGAFMSVAFSSDGKRLASGSNQQRGTQDKPVPGLVKVSDAQTGQELK